MVSERLALALAALAGNRGQRPPFCCSFRSLDIHCYSVVFLERRGKRGVRNGYFAGRFSGRWRYPPRAKMLFRLQFAALEVAPADAHSFATTLVLTRRFIAISR